MRAKEERKFLSDTLESTDAIMEDDNLPSSIEFSSDGGDQYLVVPTRDDGFDRFFAFWGRREEGYLTKS